MPCYETADHTVNQPALIHSVLQNVTDTEALITGQTPQLTERAVVVFGA